MSLFPLSNIMLIQSRVRHLLGDRPGKNLSTGPYALSVVLTELLELLAVIGGEATATRGNIGDSTRLDKAQFYKGRRWLSWASRRSPSYRRGLLQKPRASPTFAMIRLFRSRDVEPNIVCAIPEIGAASVIRGIGRQLRIGKRTGALRNEQREAGKRGCSERAVLEARHQAASRRAKMASCDGSHSTRAPSILPLNLKGA
jgi:hypothetical protein